MTRPLAWYQLREEIEDFLYLEADLLDQRRFKEWLDLLAEDLVYFMPMRRNVKFGQHAERENTRQGEGISWFDEDKWTLGKRVEQILTGVHYAEEPLSRVTHMVSNVRLLDVRPSVEDAQEVTCGCRFLVYQNRVEYENYTFVGRRTDELRRAGTSWQIARREIILEQNVLLAKNLRSSLTPMIELTGVAVGNKLRLVGGITAEVLEIVNDEWAKVRLVEVPDGEAAAPKNFATPPTSSKSSDAAHRLPAQRLQPDGADARRGRRPAPAGRRAAPLRARAGRCAAGRVGFCTAPRTAVT